MSDDTEEKRRKPKTKAKDSKKAKSATGERTADNEDSSEKSKPRGKGKKAGGKSDSVRRAPATAPLPDSGGLEKLLAGEHNNPHSILGAHPATLKLDGDNTTGVIVRAFHPSATAAFCIVEGDEPIPLEAAGGLFSAFLPGFELPLRYSIRFEFEGGATWERDDPYRFLPTLGEIDLHLFNEGTHLRLWEKLGAQVRTVDGTQGVAFAVWAPNARRVSLVGDFNEWDGRLYPMRALGASGVFELFVPGAKEGSLYKFELLTREGLIRVKTDPFAGKLQQSPGTASIVVRRDSYEWEDAEWLETRRRSDPLREPMLVYEVHLGSWARVPEEGDRSLTYREIAPRLVEHVKELGFTHIELLPIAEHPFTGSWGYQVSGYYAPTSRFGSPDDFRFLVDSCHQAGIGVLLDWVPAHFPKDDFALRRFDGTALYEHEDPRLGEHPDWGTLIFNYGRAEVRNFLLANALYWLQEYHIDGLRVDAVASMLYLDYSRKAGEWLRNRHGGRENLEAIDFLRAMTDMVRTEEPGCITVAEESTAWPGVTRPTAEGGLGFTFKWNMGWMHDTLEYFQRDPLYRRHHQDQLTFAMMYEYSEHFVMPLSHDEMVHLKKSLVDKMPGDVWQKFANLRVMLSYMLTRPGKKLLFMGTEVAPWKEWNHDVSIDWHLGSSPLHAGMLEFMRAIGNIYRERAPLWRRDHEPDGFTWIDVADRENSVVSYARRDGQDHMVMVLNLLPIPREDYRVGVPAGGQYRILLSSDDTRFGGSGYGQADLVEAEPSPFHGYPQSVRLVLPPLSALILQPEEEE